jgi:glyoxylase-like metal-dependent hydrolase (beta-lactamase superfamily II)
VLVADVDVCFAGDLCWFGSTPLGFQSNPTTWVGVLDAIVELADVIVPGHGPIGGEREARELQTYLQACVDAQGDVHAIPSGPWDAWVGREHDAINVERAAMLARGDDDIPPSMLDAMGFA